MKPSKIVAFACLATLVTAIIATQAMAWAGKLSSPDVALPSDFSEADREKISTALNRDDCKFVGGHFINSFTSLRYQGQTQALNLMIDDLTKCPGASVAVRFDNREFEGEADWLIAHDVRVSNQFTVHISLNSPRIKLDELALPEFKQQADEGEAANKHVGDPKPAP